MLTRRAFVLFASFVLFACSGPDNDTCEPLEHDVLGELVAQAVSEERWNDALLMSLPRAVAGDGDIEFGLGQILLMRLGAAESTKSRSVEALPKDLRGRQRLCGCSAQPVMAIARRQFGSLMDAQWVATDCQWTRNCLAAGKALLKPVVGKKAALRRKTQVRDRGSTQYRTEHLRLVRLDRTSFGSVSVLRGTRAGTRRRLDVGSWRETMICSGRWRSRTSWPAYLKRLQHERHVLSGNAEFPRRFRWPGRMFGAQKKSPGFLRSLLTSLTVLERLFRLKRLSPVSCA